MYFYCSLDYYSQFGNFWKEWKFRRSRLGKERRTTTSPTAKRRKQNKKQYFYYKYIFPYSRSYVYIEILLLLFGTMPTLCSPLPILFSFRTPNSYRHFNPICDSPQPISHRPLWTALEVVEPIQCGEQNGDHTVKTGTICWPAVVSRKREMKMSWNCYGHFWGLPIWVALPGLPSSLSRGCGGSGRRIGPPRAQIYRLNEIVRLGQRNWTS